VKSVRKLRWLLPVVALFVVISTTSVLADIPDEYGTKGHILGVTFTGGDGSYKRVVHDGIVLGISPDFPWTYQDPKTNQYDGVDVEIFREVTRRLGISKVTFDMLPGYASLIPSLLAKRNDVLIDNIHENPDRLAVIDFTSPAYYYGAAIAVQKGNPKHINTWEDLAGKVAATYAGTFYQAPLQARKDIKQVKLYTTSALAFADLAAGRIDAVVDDGIKIVTYIKNNPGVNMQLSNATFPPGGYARYGLRKEDVDLNMAVSRAIDEMRADGTIMRIITKFDLSPSWMFNYALQVTK
jgi:polar amino acid transport system substrate-binding protein